MLPGSLRLSPTRLPRIAFSEFEGAFFGQSCPATTFYDMLKIFDAEWLRFPIRLLESGCVASNLTRSILTVVLRSMISYSESFVSTGIFSGFSTDSSPIVACISRLMHQSLPKGAYTWTDLSHLWIKRKNLYWADSTAGHMPTKRTGNGPGLLP